MGKNTHKMTYLLYKKLSDIGHFLHVITVLDMSKISNIIDFDAYLVFLQQQIFKKTYFHGVSGCFCQLQAVCLGLETIIKPLCKIRDDVRGCPQSTIRPLTSLTLKAYSTS